jgi:hypothetical protein
MEMAGPVTSSGCANALNARPNEIDKQSIVFFMITDF